MSRISKAFKRGKALITFIMAGDPSLEATEKIVLDLEKNGSDIVEIGIPFSDSIADGPTIVDAANRAISKNVTALDAIKLARHIRKKSNIPMVFMTSYNIVFSYGADKFFADAASAGVDGLIMPDLPLEESKNIREKVKRRGMDLIFLVAPNSSDERIKYAAKSSGGFIYLISLTGITGARKKLSDTISKSVKKIRTFTNKPIAVGFGISSPSQAKEAVKYADGVIVGSAIVKMIEERKPVGNFIKSLKTAVSS